MDDVVGTELATQARQGLAQLSALIDAVDMAEPDPVKVGELKKLLDDIPAFWAFMGDVNASVQKQLIERLHSGRSGAMAMAKGIEIMRRDLGHDHAPPLERILIEHVLTCWLRMQDVEWRYSTKIGNGKPIAISHADWWERRLSSAQRRYLRACETLARVRKLARRTPALQINVAAHGGQQVNIVGDTVAK